MVKKEVKKQEELKVFTFPKEGISVKAIDYKGALKELKIILSDKQN